MTYMHTKDQTIEQIAFAAHMLFYEEQHEGTLQDAIKAAASELIEARMSTLEVAESSGYDVGGYTDIEAYYADQDAVMVAMGVVRNLDDDLYTVMNIVKEIA